MEEAESFRASDRAMLNNKVMAASTEKFKARLHESRECLLQRSLVCSAPCRQGLARPSAERLGKEIGMIELTTSQPPLLPPHF